MNSYENPPETAYTESCCRNALQIDLQTLLTGYHDLLDGKTHLGTLGTTVNIGNLLAAVFIATGQDVASLPECANGLLIIRPANRQEIDSCGKHFNHRSSV